jgi:hypothetical protein
MRAPQVAFFKSDPMSGAILVSHSPVHQVKVALHGLNKKQASMHRLR